MEETGQTCLDALHNLFSSDIREKLQLTSSSETNQIEIASNKTVRVSTQAVLHPYHTLNLYETQQQFNANIEKLRSLIKLHQHWTTHHKDVMLNRYLKLLKVQNIIR